jgi:hypothetical protein
MTQSAIFARLMETLAELESLRWPVFYATAVFFRGNPRPAHNGNSVNTSTQPKSIKLDIFDTK